MNLIDGYNGGIPHIEADMIRDHNIALYGNGDYILPVGNKFEASIKSNNAVTIKDGMAVIGGARVNIPYGQTETMTIENGTSGYYRKDLIVIEYTKNENGVENAVLKVVKGSIASSAANAKDPAVTTGDIRAGASKHQAVLARVSISGLSISKVETVMETGFGDIDDYVIETGHSGIWEYRIFSNGIAECWVNKGQITGVDLDQAFGTLYYRSIYFENYPFEFITLPTISITATCTSANALVASNLSDNTTANVGRIFLYAPAVCKAQTLLISVRAIGRIR